MFAQVGISSLFTRWLSVSEVALQTRSGTLSLDLTEGLSFPTTLVIKFSKDIVRFTADVPVTLSAGFRPRVHPVTDENQMI